MAFLAELGEETFGERLHRARVRRGVHLRTLAERVSLCWPVSYGLIHRLESEVGPPTDRRRRIIAVLAVLALGYEPSAFGLSREDVPPGMDLAALDPGIVSAPESPLRGSPDRPDPRSPFRLSGCAPGSAGHRRLLTAA
jgi:transcriptional regulator with XRE-family HTH domain